MNKNNKGAGTQVSGSLKEAIGKVVGDTKIESEGAMEKATSKEQDWDGKKKRTASDIVKE